MSSNYCPQNLYPQTHPSSLITMSSSSTAAAFLISSPLSTPPHPQSRPRVLLTLPAQFSINPSTRSVIGRFDSSLPSFRYRSLKIRSCTQPTSPESPFTTTIDVTAQVKSQKIVVLGGNGFVGSAICKSAISKGMQVTSLNRSGRPSSSDSWVDQVTWIEGDVFYANWEDILDGETTVVSTLGGFGDDDQMNRINGEANIVSVNAAKDYGVPKFILISVHDYNLPQFLLSSGYFTGKRKAEAEVFSKYPRSGVVLRPGFIYGKRKVDNYQIPLDLIGKPLEKFLAATQRFTKPLASLPISDLLLAPPVSVEDVALAVVNAVFDDDVFGLFTIEQIKEAAAKVRT